MPTVIPEPTRPYICLTCEVSTPAMTDAEAAAERAAGHDLMADADEGPAPVTRALFGRYAGVEALAKVYKGRVSVKTYANRTQAEKARETFEKTWNRPAWVIGTYPFYVRVG